jgi:hypothetical protein
MMRLSLSDAAAGLLRALLARTAVSRDRILLSEFRSADWQSLTFIGERHQISLRIPGPGADDIVQRLTAGIEDAEFAIAGHLVADITLAEPPLRNGDGSISVEIEALTIAE